MSLEILSNNAGLTTQFTGFSMCFFKLVSTHRYYL